MNGATLLICASLLAYDGDTVKCDGVSMRPMGDGRPHVFGFDKPEIGHRARCKEEHRLGILARDRLQELLDLPGTRIWDSGEVDVYDRPLVWIETPDGRTAGSILTEEQLARIWKPRHKNNWCGS
jgi:micrococcal nuclease